MVSDCAANCNVTVLEYGRCDEKAFSTLLCSSKRHGMVQEKKWNRGKMHSDTQPVTYQHAKLGIVAS